MNITLIGPSLNQRGGIVSVISGLRDFLTQKHVNIRTIGTTADGSIWKIISTFIQAWLITLSLCLLRKTDVIHLHIASRGSCLRKSTLALTCWMLRTPFILHLHGAEFQAFYNNELPFIGRQFVKFIFRRAARVIALSNSWQDWLNVTLKLKNVTVVFNGVPTIATTNVPKQNTILFLGRLGPRKGTDELISAMRMVIRNFPDAVLELGGDGDIDHYRQQAGNLPNIRFLGWIDDNERAAALSRANIFCLPSWNEGLPMSVLEAMSAGLPV
ncbi:glycosyltransferase, GG-Bacteroidales peptide system [compost metagenome]